MHTSSHGFRAPASHVQQKKTTSIRASEGEQTMRENCGVSGGGYSRESRAASASVSSRSGSKPERRKASNQASTVRAHNQAVSHLLPIFPPRPLNNLSLRLAEYSKSFAPHVHQAVGVLRNAT